MVFPDSKGCACRFLILGIISVFSMVWGEVLVFYGRSEVSGDERLKRNALWRDDCVGNVLGNLLKSIGMRLWSLHPEYLDVKGLTACWREGLLARKVLSGGTRGYLHHPRLIRFRSMPDPVLALDTYLQAVLEEARRRGYRFDSTKISPGNDSLRMQVTSGQLIFEAEHLRRKLRMRQPLSCANLPEDNRVKPHPMFDIIEGGVEKWEIR